MQGAPHFSSNPPQILDLGCKWMLPLIPKVIARLTSGMMSSTDPPGGGGSSSSGFSPLDSIVLVFLSLVCTSVDHMERIVRHCMDQKGVVWGRCPTAQGASLPQPRQGGDHRPNGPVFQDRLLLQEQGIGPVPHLGGVG